MIFPDLWFDQEDDVFKGYKVVNGKGEESNYLPQLSRVNIFIGPNNSGKSRFHRKFFHQLFKTITSDTKARDNLKKNALDFSTFSLAEVPSVIQEIFEKVKQHAPTELIENDDRFRTAYLLLQKLAAPPMEFSTDALLSFQDISQVKNKIGEVKNAFAIAFDRDVFNGEQRLEVPLEIRFLENYSMTKVLKKIDQAANLDFTKQSLSYIPALRTLRSFPENPIQAKFWYDHFRTYNKDDQMDEFLFTGESLYTNIQSNLLGLINQIEAHIEFSKFIGDTFYNGQKVSITAPINRKDKSQTNIMVKIGSDDELPITELGDGVQAIIGLTYQLYTRSDQSHFLFIDEPEQNLHPGFQRIFMETLLLDRFKDTQVFICTHSNHFLDMSLDYPKDISIYSFQKKIDQESKDNHFEIKHRAGRDKEVLQMIGARNSSVFLSNCTLWVEGITDRLYIRVWLAIYQKMIQRENSGNKEYHEDLHFSFIEFGGANITHWSFLDTEEDTEERGTENEKLNHRIDIEAICGPVLVIADEDGSGAEMDSEVDDEDLEEKAKRHRLLRQNLEDNYLMLDRKEIENMLLPDQLKAGVNDTYKTKTYDFSDFGFDDYKDQPIADFLINKITQDNKPAIATKKSGTFGSKKKKEVCLAVIENLKSHMNASDDPGELKKLLSPDGRDEEDNSLDTPYQLAKKVYEFIQKHNE